MRRKRVGLFRVGRIGEDLLRVVTDSLNGIPCRTIKCPYVLQRKRIIQVNVDQWKVNGN